VKREGSTLAEIAALHRVDLRTVQRWISEDGLPSSGNGRSRRIDPAVSITWRIERDRQLNTVTPGEAAERTRKLRIEADIKQLELDQLRGTLAPVEQHHRQYDEFVAGFVAVVRGQLRRFEPGIVRATTPGDARRLTDEQARALLEGARAYADELDAAAEEERSA
jgi:hypothetical protein